MSKQEESLNKNLVIIWGALLSTHFIYLGVGTISAPEVQEMEQMLMGILGGVGFMAPITALFIFPSIFPKAKANLFVVHILQYAIIEFAAIMGLVGKLMGAPAVFQYSLAAVAIVSMLYVSPLLSKK